MTRYSEAGSGDTDVAAFLAARFEALNLQNPPSAIWVARDDDGVCAVLLLTAAPMPLLHLVLRQAGVRLPFLRVYRLWLLARTWLQTHDVPVICVLVANRFVHLQTLLMRAGFIPLGSGRDAQGHTLSTLFGTRLDTEAPCLSA